MDEINLTTRKRLIKNTSGFSVLGNDLITQLAVAMEEVHVEEGQVIVTEGDLIDSVYLIAKGSAAVSKQVIEEGKKRATLLAILHHGDNIGLKASGLYSGINMRTATVVAHSVCILLKIQLDTLQRILKQNTQTSDIMYENLSSALKVRLIKESIQVTNVSNERLVAIAKTAQEMSFAKGDVIFVENLSANHSFILYEGRVEIIQTSTLGETNTYSLEPGELLGDDSLVSHGMWNATARALMPCKLLMLNRSDVLELTETNQDDLGADGLTFLLANKNHPVRTPNIIYQQQTLPDGESIVTLKNPADYTYMQLNEYEWFVWLQSNGDLTPAEIANETSTKFPHLAINDVLGILQNLFNQGFIYLDTTIKPLVRKKEITQYKQEGLFNWLKWVHFLKQPEQFANLLYAYGGAYLVSIPACCIYLLVIFAGLIAFPLITPLAIKQIPDLPLLPLTLLLALSMSMVFNLITPLLKILAIKRVGHVTPHIGLIWHAIGPAVYVDASDLLMGDKKTRIWVGMITLMSNFLTASIVSAYAYYSSASNNVVFYWLCALFLYLQALRSLDPMQNLEGYTLLAESLNVPKLRFAAFNLFEKEPSSRVFFQKKMLFWLYCLLYLGANLMLASWLLRYLGTQWSYLASFQTLALLLISISFACELLIEWHTLKKNKLAMG